MQNYRLSEGPPERVTPVMFQSWNFISFLHWRYPPEVLRPYLPEGLQLDTFDGSGWVSLTPFRVERLRPVFVPSLPWISNFPEMNLRTYVRGPRGPGIWFFSLDAHRLAAVLGARLTYGLPYYWADMQVRVDASRVDYYSSRGGRARARITVDVQAPLDGKDDLTIFLTERYKLYARHLGVLAFAAVEHRPWPLHRAHTVVLEETVRQAAHLASGPEPPLVHYSPGVRVRIGCIKKA
jgi:uncharacterized protein